MSQRGRIHIVAGLGAGDEGKGTTVDYLARRERARVVVRYNGGPQAAHHVVQEDGRWHCFSQFGSGTFVPQVRTFLSRYMFIEPTNLLAELRVLRKKGVRDARPRLAMDARCPLVTPGHKMIGQMLEVARGKRRFGSVGMGVGQAVLDHHAGRCPTLGHARDGLALRKRLEPLIDRQLARAEQLRRQSPGPALDSIHQYFVRELDLQALIDRYLGFASAFAPGIVSDEDPLGAAIDSGEALVFEGAQGALLDPVYGPHPYITKTQCTMAPALRLLGLAPAAPLHQPAPARGGSQVRWADQRRTSAPGGQALRARLTKIGVVRAYAHRHGEGPLVTADPRLGACLPEVHNLDNRWQGKFRVGWFDVPATRYAIAINGGVDSVALTGLDRLSGLSEVLVCLAYAYSGPHGDLLGEFFDQEVLHNGQVRLIRWKLPQDPGAARQENLGRVLHGCRPLEFKRFRGWQADISGVRDLAGLPGPARELIAFLQSDQGLGVPIGLLSVGPVWTQKIEVIS